jgi:dsDNA-specific endonuclease/ATPase MutS2
MRFAYTDCMFTWIKKLFQSPEPTVKDSKPEEEEMPPEVVEVPITDWIDLHTVSPKETADVTATYLEEAHQANFREVRIIHGKGKGVQREIIHSLLRKHPLVQSFQIAPPERGGWGATIVILKERP